jgi:probable rRNA maturation factor
MTDDTFQIHVNTAQSYEIDLGAVRLAIHCVLHTVQQAPPVELTILLASADAVHQLNRDYAQIDSTTDVLSFPSEGDPYDTEPGEPPYLGDIVVAMEVAEEQAKSAGHTLLAEVQTLVIHGTLHLLGYDHDSPDAQAEMWAYQSAALDILREESQ